MMMMMMILMGMEIVVMRVGVMETEVVVKVANGGVDHK